MASPTPARPDESGDRRADLLVALAGVFCVALTLRWGHLVGLRSGLSDTGLFSTVRGDATLHWREALEVLEGHLMPWSGVPWKAPGYTYFLAGLMKLFGTSPGTLRWPLALLGAVNCAALVLIARRSLPLFWSVVAGLLAAVNGLLIFYDGELYFPTLLISLSLGALWLLGRPRCGRPGALGAGVLIGLAALVHAVYLLPAALVALWLRRRDWVLGLVFAAGVAASVVPMTLANTWARGQPVLISWNGGINVYVGNQPTFDQYSGNRTRAWARVLQSTLDAGIETEAERDRFYYRLAATEALRHPVRAASILLRKLGALLSPVEYANNVQIYELRTRSPVLAATLGRWGPLWLPLGLVGPLALVGLASRLRRASWQETVVALLAAGIAASMLISFVTARYRAPIVFFAGIWVAHVLADAAAAWSASNRRRLARLGLAFIAAAGVVAVLAVPQRGFPLPLEWDQASLLAGQGNVDTAEPWVEAAARKAPDDPELLHAIAGFYAAQDRGEIARQWLERLLALEDLEPEMRSIGHQLLARSWADEGAFELAREQIAAARAVRVDATSWHGRPHYRLGLGPVSDCWLRLEGARIELDAGAPDRARPLIASVRRDCRETGRFAERLQELDVELILVSAP